MPRLRSDGRQQPIFKDVPVPISIRRDNVEPSHPKSWKLLHRRQVPTPFFRVGVRTQAFGSKRVGSALIGLSVGLLSLLLLFRFAVYVIHNPGLGLGVLVISSGAVWLRYAHLSSLTDLAELTGNGFTVRDWVVFDTASYFAAAVRVYSNQVEQMLHWPIGMPTFSAFLFQWSGIHLQVPKLGFAVLQALVGPLLFFCCLPVVRNKWLAFLPLLTWSVFFRPMKYSYYYLTESLAMCLMIAWIAILFSRDPRTRDRQWLWIVLSSSLLFGLASYTRDVVVTFLPAFLGMVVFFVGTNARQRLISAGTALAMVVALWCATPVLFADKKLSLNPSDFLPITSRHYRSPNRLGRQTRRRPLAPPGEAGLSPAVRKVVEQASSRPVDFLGERYAEAKHFWDPKQRWNRSINDNPAYRESVLARLVESELKHGATYGGILVVLLSTAVFGLLFSPRWVALAGLFLYVTLFHVLLFPGFTSRPKAIFFPFMVLFAGAGIFALLEGFFPWLRGKIAARSEPARELG